MHLAKQSSFGPPCVTCKAPAHRSATTKTTTVGTTEVIYLVFQWACSRCGALVEGPGGAHNEVDTRELGDA